MNIAGCNGVAITLFEVKRETRDNVQSHFCVQLEGFLYLLSAFSF